MSVSRTIEIDLDVHRAIELARESFEQTPNDILRKKLGVGAMRSSPVVPQPEVSGQEGSAWVRDGLTLRDGTPIRFSYNGITKVGSVANGMLVFENKEFDAPSRVVIHFCRTRDGRRTHLNGWRMIQAKPVGESTWHSLDALRDAVRGQTPSLKALRQKLIDEAAAQLLGD